MKVVTKPSVPETAHYECDVTGVPLSFGPAASIRLCCGFGAPYDGDSFELHLSEKAAEVILPLLRALVLGGGPLEPHRTDSIFQTRGLHEKRVTGRERIALLERLEKLCRYRRQTLKIVKKGLAESAAGKKVGRGSFAQYAITGPKLTSAQAEEARKRTADLKSGQDSVSPRERALLETKRVAVGAARRKRVLLPEFKKMMRSKKSNDVRTALNEDRGDR